MKLLLAVTMLLSISASAVESGLTKKADGSFALKRSKAARIV